MIAEIKQLFHSLDGREGVRRTALIVGVVQVAFWTWLYIAQHSNPKGDGMEWVAMGPATAILIMFVWPALQFSRKNELLLLSLLLASLAAFMNVALFVEIAREFAETNQ
jgi:hypothetical protein